MSSICWLGLITSIIGILAFVWNVYRTDRHVITGSSVSLIFAFLIGIALMFEPASVTLPWIAYEKIKKEADRSELAVKAVSEVMAIQQWNQGRLPDEQSSHLQKEEAKKTLKKIYGDDYNKQMLALHKRGIILSLPSELPKEIDVDTSLVKPYFEIINSTK